MINKHYHLKTASTTVCTQQTIAEIQVFPAFSEVMALQQKLFLLCSFLLSLTRNILMRATAQTGDVWDWREYFVPS